MARIRSIKPEFWMDRKLARKMSRDARMLYVGLWNQADEHARLNGDLMVIKGAVFPYDDDIDLTVIDKLLDEIASAECAIRYEVDEDPYVFLPKLSKHQRLEASKVPSRLPPPPGKGGPPHGRGSRADSSKPRANESARDADSSESRSSTTEDPSERRKIGTNHLAEHAMESAEVDASPDTSSRLDSSANVQVGPQSTSRANESARGADESALFYVAGSREQGACSRDAARGDVDAKPHLAAVPDSAADEPPRVTPDFDAFWAVYPKRVDKGHARTAWKAALKRGAKPDAVIAAAAEFAESKVGSDKQFIPYPATWLNGERYNDAPEEFTTRKTSGQHETYKAASGDDGYYADF